MEKIIVVDLGGGIGNRFQNLINGFYFKEKYNFTKMYVAWRSQWTWVARYSDFFKQSKEYELIEECDLGYPPSIWQTGNIYPPGYTSEHFTTIIPTDYPCKVHLMEKHINVVVKESEVFTPIGTEKCLKIVRDKLPDLSDSLQAKVQSFMEENKLSRDKFVGVHIRRTDRSGQGPTDEYYTQKIFNILQSDPDMKFFICSDEPAVEEKIKNIFPKNVFFRKKDAKAAAVPFIGKFLHSDPQRNRVPFTKEIDDKLESMMSREGTNPPDWWLKERDIGSGRMLYNIYRSKDSVSEAMVDFFILSESKFVMNSVGSYYAMASRISSSRKI